jgi:hypothetical protein
VTLGIIWHIGAHFNPTDHKASGVAPAGWPITRLTMLPTYGRLTKTFPGMNGEGFRSLMRYIQGRIEQMGDQIREELPLTGLPGSVMEIAHAVLPHDASSLQ